MIINVQWCCNSPSESHRWSLSLSHPLMFVYVVIDSYMNCGRTLVPPTADSDQYLLRSYPHPVVCVFLYFHNGRFLGIHGRWSATGEGNSRSARPIDTSRVSYRLHHPRSHAGTRGRCQCQPLGCRRAYVGRCIQC